MIRGRVDPPEMKARNRTVLLSEISKIPILTFLFLPTNPWHKNCYNRDVNENGTKKREKTGFEKSLEGEQKWPPEVFRIRVISTLLSGSDEFVPPIVDLDIRIRDAIKIP